jgi:eukaryotic-like serine/threonine-protein kinase
VTATELANRYRLERTLGRGGMAVVHLARDIVLDRPVAVKLLTDGAGSDPDLRARFLREGRLAAALSHQNVVRVFDTGEDGDQPYIVMEYVEGRSLAELRRQETLEPEDVVSLGRQACAGLAHAHKAGIVHRDVKPQNLLLQDDGVLKVADFGIARGSSGATITVAGTLLGTAGYMAPELVAGEPATPASDLYALGAVLYELLAGRPPREVTTIADLAFDGATVTPVDELAPDAPPALAAAIMRCLDPDPAARPASASELALELEGLSEAPTRVSPDAETHVQRRAPADRLSVGTTQSPRLRRRSRAWPLLAAAAALVLAVVALSFVRDGGNGGNEAPPPVEPVPAAETPAEGARNLSNWLRENAEDSGG